MWAKMEENGEDVGTEITNLDLAIDEIDDKEFDLPEITSPQTLESILNEPDDDVFMDELVPPELLQGEEQGDTISMSSNEGMLDSNRTPTKRKHKKSIRYAQHGSILRHVVLKGVSAQLMSAADRVDAGMPTAIAVSSLIAVGTSHGLVLVFDPKQVMKWCLGSTAVGAQYGAVSALSFNRDCTRLLTGFAKGQITMWDLTNGKLLRTITDAHPPGTAILHVKFTDESTLAVCSDSGGSVFELEFKRLIGVRTCDSRCLFSGSRGEVCTIEPLHMNYTIPDHPMRDVLLLAMASLSKVLIVTLRPQLKVMFTHPLKGDASTLPLLAWQFVIIQVSEKDRVIDPVLAFARDQNIFFFQVVCHGPDNMKFVGLQKTQLPYKLLNLMWMNSRTMVAIDTSERAHVIDVRSEEELEVIDLVDVQLAYSTSFYKSLATGGNVSQALAYAGERACYHSMVSFNSQLVLLGTKSVHVMTMRNWQDRLDILVKQAKYQEALALALSFYNNKAKGVVGLGGGSHKRRSVVSDRMLDLLLEYVDVAMTKHSPKHGKVEELEIYYQDVVPVCVDYCLALDMMDILFDRIYERFSSDVLARGVFLECLEPYILLDKLVSITPVVMKDFVDHYENKGMLQNVEACIVHLHIASLDIHQVVSLCWAHGLYDAILYIYNKGMQDYTTPLEELLSLLTAALSTGKQLTDRQIKLGNKLLVYISCCLAGRAYPLGEIPEEHVTRVKDEVFKTVTCLHTKNKNEDDSEFFSLQISLEKHEQHSSTKIMSNVPTVNSLNLGEKRANFLSGVIDFEDEERQISEDEERQINEPVYPHLKTLLRFDTREFFNVLALAFEETEFNTEEGQEKKQRLVDILLQIMVESVGFTPTQVGTLFTFLARQMAKAENTIMVNRVLFEQVLEFLSNPHDESRHEERQQAVLELLNTGVLDQFEETKLLTLAENAKFFQVCELLYEKRREFDKIFACYWRDPARQECAFDYVEQITLSPGFSLDEKKAVEKEVMSQIKDLVEIDSRKTAQLVLASFSLPLGQVVRQLSDNEEVLYSFLQGVFEYRESSGSAIYIERNIPVEPELHEMYIELMCKQHPPSVCTYLKMAEGYRLEETLEICRKHRIPDATAYLLEKTGDILGAFNIFLEALQSKLKKIEAKLTEHEGEDLAVSWSNVNAVLLIIIQLCQRNSPKMDETQREALWFPLLDTMMTPQRRLKDRINRQSMDEYRELTRHVLNSMMGYIALPAILQKILQDPSYSTGKFGEIRELLMGMLDTYNYEKTLLNTCNNLVNHDLHVHLSSLTFAANRAVVPRTESCCLCNKSFTGQHEENIICFRCGHGYHATCLKSVGSSYMIEGEQHWMCYLCNSSKRGRLPSMTSRMQRLSSSGGGSGSSVMQSIGRSGKKQSHEIDMDPAQVQAMENLRRVQKTQSRLAILTELSKPDSRSRGFKSSSSSILQNEEFQLRLAPPPLLDQSD